MTKLLYRWHCKQKINVFKRNKVQAHHAPTCKPDLVVDLDTVPDKPRITDKWAGHVDYQRNMNP